LRGATPYKVIQVTGGGFLAVDMIDGEIDHLCPPSFHDEFADNEIWIGVHKKNSSFFEAYHRNRGEKHTFYYDLHYRLHREDGPAQIIDDGSQIRKIFWLDGVQYPSAEDWFDALPDKKKAAFNLDEVL
jgi:hypothetical protein